MSTPQPQQNLISVEVALFEQRSASSPPFEHGNCKCAIAAQPADPKPRYKLVCYSEGAAVCVASIGATNENSVQFEMQTTDYASFKDDDGKVWSLMFLRSIDVEPFLAHLATAIFGAAGSPTHSATIADYAPTGTKGSSIAPSHSGKKVELGRRVRTRYTAFAIRRAASSLEIPKITELLETNGEAPFACDPVQSPFGIPSEGKGFESSLVGASEGCWRAIVIPQSMPRSCNTPMLNIHTVVFIVQITRIVADAAASGAGGGALVLAGGTSSNGGGVPDAFGTYSSASATIRAGGSHQLVLHSGNNESSYKNNHNNNMPVSVFGTHTQGQGVGSGVPAEHMLFVQKLAGQVNTAVSTLKDLQDRVDGMNSEWKQNQNRPKPSTLSAASLEDGVKKLCMEHERLRDELLRREELIRALDDRNRDLQKAVDKAAMAAQQLLDEKKKAATKTNDNRLDSDRQVMKIQESILRARSERDDLARHLQTVKRLLDASDQELRDAKGKKEVVLVQLQALSGKLDASEENLGEERSRRKAFEAKVGALTEEIRNSTAELHLKTAQVEDWRRKADAERVHYMQLMEDERSRRGVESAQLRSEIIDELQQRDRKFEADRARTQQEHFSRGHDEGKEVGRKTARADYDVRMQELSLEAQRAKTELDSYKDQLREAQDTAQANHRRLDAAIGALKQQVEEGTRSKAQLEFQVQRAQAQVKSAEDSLFLGISALAHRLIMPVEPGAILDQLDNLRAGKVMDLSFQEHNFASATQSSKLRRQGIVFDTLLALHDEGLAAIFDSIVADMCKAHTDVFDTIGRLWQKRQADERYAVVSCETTERAEEIVQDEQTQFDQIVSFARHQNEERAAVGRDFDEGYDEIRKDEEDGMNAIEAVIFEQKIKAQKEIIDEEELARAILESEEEPAEFQAAVVDEAASDVKFIEEVEKFRRAQSAQRQEVESDEHQVRSSTADKAQDDEWDDLLDTFESSKPKPPTPRPPTPRPAALPDAAPAQPQHVGKGDDSDSDDDLRRGPVPPPPPPHRPTQSAATRVARGVSSDDDDDAREAKSKRPSAAPPQQIHQQQQQQRGRTAADVDFDQEESQAENTRESVGKTGFVLPVTKQNPNKPSLFGGADSDSESEADGPAKPFAPKPAAAPPAVQPNPAAASPTTAHSNNNNNNNKLFGSDSDDDTASGPKRATAPPVVAKKAPALVLGKKAVAKPANKLFASSDDD